MRFSCAGCGGVLGSGDPVRIDGAKYCALCAHDKAESDRFRREQAFFRRITEYVRRSKEATSAAKT